ncbi:DUF192 domain-containing protein [Anaerosinus massiliensis]|uniref:DUF192 domain-containing protein n=1 Tax=Massilibacillus massiliensis TaxID=1806837 RepID=UPI000DA5F486|nr:DUF192 domain-containing protein [Massilibacillus massiliensis]
MKMHCLAVELERRPVELKITIADTFWTRFIGLLGTSALENIEGLLLCNCNSVHMIGMRYALDIVYLDRDGRILKIIENLRPWQVSWCWKAKDTLEIKSGMVKQFNWKVGEQLNFHR